MAVNPFHGRNVRWLLDARVEVTPEKDLLVWRDLGSERRVWTYAAFRGDVDRLADALQRRGIRGGSHVCIHADNSPEFLIAWFALQSIGAVMVATNTRSTTSELGYLLGLARAPMVLTQDHHLDRVLGAARSRSSVRQVVVFDITTSTNESERGSDLDELESEHIRCERLTDLLAQGSVPEPSQVPSMNAAGVQFTSGTTGPPKGVVWTHANYLWGGKVSASHQQLRPDDRHLTFLPLFHSNAQSYSIMAALWANASVVLMPRFSTSRFWPIAVEEGATWCSSIPFAARALRDIPVPSDHRMRRWGNAAVIPSWEDRFGIPLTAWWGMTETVTQGIVSEPEGPRRPYAIGVPASEYQLRIVDDAGVPIEPEGSGLLEIKGVRGVSLFSEYLHDPEATAAAFTSDGWFRTGDRVMVHEDGAISFLERDKDMLKVGGENVAAAEIERVIAKVDGVADVAVVAGPDRMRDEVPVAFVVASPETRDEVVEAIMTTCRKHLADFKIPRHVEIVDTLPRVTLEKVAKASLRREAERLLDGGFDRDKRRRTGQA